MLSVLLLTSLVGCAAHQAPSRVIPTTWSVVAAQPPGTVLRVELDRDKALTGTMEAVTDAGLTIRKGSRVDTVNRQAIVRVYRLNPFDPPRWKHVLGGAAVGALIAGMVAVFVAPINEDDPGQQAAVMMTLGTGIGAGFASLTPGPIAYRERLIYVRS